MRSDVSNILLQKSAISFFVSEYPLLSLIVAKIRFLYSTKNMFWTFFLFCLLLYWDVFSVIALKKVFQYAGSYPNFQ